jgi:hypothetical protein
VYEDFLFYKSGVYQALGMNYLGAHVVRIVGWNDAEQAWIVQNSWGETWGENGFARIYWDDTLSQIGQFAVIQHVDSISESARTGAGGTEQASTASDPSNASTKSLANTAAVSPIFSSQDETPLTLESTVVTLAWDACANADWYRVEVNTNSAWDEGCRVFYGNIGSEPSKVMDQLESGVVYYWRVWAGNDAGESDPAVGPSFTLQTVSTSHTISASAGANGAISPEGDTTVAQGSAQTYTITPDDGYEVSDVLVDGVSVGNVTSHTFEDVQADHTISVSFKAEGGPDYDINNDGYIDVTDIMIVASNWDKKVGDAGFNSAADLNNDDCVDIVDIMMIVSMWRKSA